jgi:DNA-binding NtrC family response regulator
VQLAVAQARFIAETGCHATLIGPTGVGKQTLARTIHGHSRRRELPFVAIDCARVPADAVRSLALGSRGLGQVNAIGALYLNEPQLLPMDLQAELAHAIKDSPQLLMGSATESREALSTGTLNRDFFASLSVITVHVPPLQRRKDDILRLADEILRRHGAALMREPRSLSPNARAALQEHAWPGNLDELARVLFDAARGGTATTIDVAELPMAVRQDTAQARPKSKLPQLDQTLERVERRLIKRALAKAKGNKSKAADLLGVWRPRLLRRMETLGMTGPGTEQ